MPRTEQLLPLEPAQGASIKVVLRGEPRGWGRARVRVVVPKDPRKSPFPSFFVDAETKAYKEALAWQGKAAMRGKSLLTGPLKVEIIAVFGVPRSWSGKKRDAALAGVVRPTGKPDWDNVAKLLDAFNTLIWEDDAQVVDGRAVKTYGEEPRLEVSVAELS